MVVPKSQEIDMGTAFLIFHKAGNKSQEKVSMPVPRIADAVAEVMATSGTSARSTNAAPATTFGKDDGGFVTVFAIGANLWVNTGPTATAAKPTTGATGTGYPVLAGTKETFGLKTGEKVAAIEFV